VGVEGGFASFATGHFEPGRNTLCYLLKEASAPF
jgi:hypothetical protein